MHEEIALEIAIIERLALQAVRDRIAAQQLGEAWRDLNSPGYTQDRNHPTADGS